MQELIRLLELLPAKTGAEKCGLIRAYVNKAVRAGAPIPGDFEDAGSTLEELRQIEGENAARWQAELDREAANYRNKGQVSV